jgi:hypothetical protein
MDQSSSSFVAAAAGLKRRSAGDVEQQERRVVVGEMDFFETEMRKEKRDRKDAASAVGHAGAADDLAINKGDLTIDVSNGRRLMDRSTPILFCCLLIWRESKRI